jgi:hypothetical protein
MTSLSFTTVRPAQGLTNGQFTPWVINWQVPVGTANGFVIQHLQLVFQGIHYCGDDDILTDDTIWNLLNYSEPTRLDYWEAWQYRSGVWQPPNNADGWGFSQVGTFYTSDTAGTIVFKGSAGFYEGEDLNQFAGGWGTNGDNEGSPMSGDLMSTVETPNLPQTILAERTMTVQWNPCDCDTSDDVCRQTTITSALAGAQIT